MKFIILTAMFLSSANLYAGAKACFFKHEKSEEKFSGFGPEHFACQLAAQHCYSWAKFSGEDGRLCKFDAKFDYKPHKADNKK